MSASGAGHPGQDASIVALQLGRVPRDPWRTAARCGYGYPNVIASPAQLSDGDRFPTLAYLTCPWLVALASAEESRGGVREWARRADDDSALRESLVATDCAVRESRARESGGYDVCDGVGIAGQREPLDVKCLHAHIALELFGIDDPIGKHLLSEWGTLCPERRCDALAMTAEEDSR